MNNHELLEQADRKLAEAEKIKLAKQNVEDLERLLKVAQDDTYDLRYCGEYDLPLKQSLDDDNLEDFKGILKGTFRRYLGVQTVKLEQLLGLKPTILNPEFEVAVQDMEQSSGYVAGTIKADKITEGILAPVPVEEKLTSIPQEGAKKIEDKQIIPDTSSDKYPAKPQKKSPYPEGMTVDVVRKMYIDQGMKINDIAKHFGVNYSKVNNFITKHKLHRVCQEPKQDKPEKQPEETERP